MRLLSLCLLLGSTAAIAADPQAMPVAADAKPVKVKKICRSETPTGSMMTVRACHTREEWQHIDADNQKATSQLDQQRRTQMGGLPGG